VADTYAAAVKRLAKTLRERRLALNLSQEHVAAEVGIATRHYQDLEYGVAANPKLETLCQLALTCSSPRSAICSTPRRRQSRSARARQRLRSRKSADLAAASLPYTDPKISLDAAVEMAEDHRRGSAPADGRAKTSSPTPGSWLPADYATAESPEPSSGFLFSVHARQLAPAAATISRS